MALDKGSYIAILYSNWNSINTHFSFWSYGPQNLTIKQVKKPENIKAATDALQASMLVKAFESTDNWTHMKNPQLSKIRYKFLYGTTGYGYYVFDNPTPNIKTTKPCPQQIQPAPKTIPEWPGSAHHCAARPTTCAKTQNRGWKAPALARENTGLKQAGIFDICPAAQSTGQEGAVP